MRNLSTILALALVLLLPSTARAGEGSAPRESRGATTPRDMVRIPAGSFVPLYSLGKAPVAVKAFALDRYAVTGADYLEFVRERPRWRKSEIAPLFAGAGYLAGWPSDLVLPAGRSARAPVTQVSWFAAKAYCEWRGKRLPTVDEWEYAASADETRRDAARDPGFVNRLLALYTARRSPLPAVGSAFENVHGVHDLHGLVWEWTLDFNTVLVSDDSRGASGHHRQLYCASGTIGSTDPGNYPAFLRYAFRSGLDARSTVDNLGFRCAQSV